MIYFDNAATTPIAPEVREVIEDIFENAWANPNSLHRLGFEAQKKMENARETLAKCLSVSPKTLTFTSCATESSNLAIYNAISGKSGNAVVTTIEHSAVFEPLERERRGGRDIRYVAPEANGVVNADDVAALVDKDTLLVAVMHVNNELGTIQPIEEIAEKVKAKNPKTKILVDGVQGFGKISVSLANTPIDFYTSSGHKLHAPKGIGLLYHREGLVLKPQLCGGGQEFGLRSGTQNVPWICAFAKAAELQFATKPETVARVKETFCEAFRDFPGIIINGKDRVSPYIVNMGFSGVRAEILLHILEQQEMYLSSGSACSGKKESRVLKEIGVPKEYRDGCVRISWSRYSTEEEALEFAKALQNAVKQVRSIVG